MIYTVAGELVKKTSEFAVINVGGIGFQVAMPESSLQKLPKLKNKVQVFTYLHVRENSLELFGFTSEEELELFEALISVNGVGPKTGLNIMSVANYKSLVAAINEGKSELISKASGVGKKTAQRIAIELKGKLGVEDGARTVSLLESDMDLVETLVSLGYSKNDAREVISKIDPKITSFNERLKEALKSANKKALR
ncbi:MAG: Holliday junction branch migration protein RuvA [bacterium]|nr:Holliday junction branch migration protein RuvA [bacterium]